MTYRSLFTLFALLLCVSLTAQSVPERTKERAKNRAERRANNNVDRKVDKAVDDAFNAVGNLFKKKKKKKKAEPGTEPGSDDTRNSATDDEAEANARAMGMLSKMMGGGEDWEPYTNPHTFSLDMVMTEEKRNGKTDTQRMSVGVTEDRFGMISSGEDNESSKMILNTQTGMTTMINTDKKGEKAGYEIRIPRLNSDAVQEEIDAVDMDRFSWEKTGQRRTIDGYDCELIIMKDSKTGTTSESWVTQDIGLTTMDVFGGLAKSFGAKSPKVKGSDAVYEGFPIESKTVDNGKTITTRFTNIRIGEANVDRSLLSTDGVTIQKVGF